MLETLEWRLFPPTPYTFCKYLSRLILSEDCRPRPSQRILRDLREIARFFTELSVCDYFFITYNQSTVGLASLLNAIDVLIRQKDLTSEMKRDFMERVFYYTGLNPFSSEVEDCRRRLRETYVKGGFEIVQEGNEGGQPSSSGGGKNEENLAPDTVSMANIPSPVCVSGVPASS